MTKEEKPKEEMPIVAAQGAVGAVAKLHTPDGMKEEEYAREVKNGKEAFAAFEGIVRDLNKSAMPQIYIVGKSCCAVIGDGARAAYGEKIVSNYAKDTGITQDYVKRSVNMVRTWPDEKEFLNLVEKRGLTMSHMEAINPIAAPEERRKMAERVAEGRLTVRDTKEAIKEETKKDSVFVSGSSKATTRTKSPEEKKKRLTEQPDKSLQYFMAKSVSFMDACATLFLGLNNVKNMSLEGSLAFKAEMKPFNTTVIEVAKFSKELSKMYESCLKDLEQSIKEKKEAAKEQKGKADKKLEGIASAKAASDKAAVAKANAKKKK